MTRLAEITHLDRIGAPVFHAVRPWSRSLSVHQGKGLNALEAQIGALMEAVESAHAEAFEQAPVMAALHDLPAGERAPTLLDFAPARTITPAQNEPLAWVAAIRILDGGRLWVPFDAVSLDFTRLADARIQRSSNGQAARFDRSAAIENALLEVIERDALAAWFAMSPLRRTQSLMDPRAIDYPWFRDLADRLDRAGVALALYKLEAVTGHPAFIAEITDRASVDGRGCGFYGAACRQSPEAALRESLLEAAQSRATDIAGARDDIFYRPPQTAGMGLAPPPSVYMKLLSWDAVAATTAHARAPNETGIAISLAEAGYPQAAVVDLSPPGSDVSVVKAFVPGLGAFGRARRLQ